ncbi:MAG: DUF4129 domain-containing protein, partial [Phycisphaerales bacterium]|nr:DUF4129 domain-containing protein [Phycisphaerales bacterium]
VWKRRSGPAHNRPVGVNNIERIGDITRAPQIEQRITIRNKSSEYIFALFRPVRISFDRDSDMVVSMRDYALSLPRRNGRVSYTVYSQADYSRPRSAAPEERLPPMFREGRIHDLATRVLAEVEFERDVEDWNDPNDRLIANQFERWLRKNFSYSTTMTAPEAGEDPIEMFLFRTREGHCEYFASAMAAMCRSVGMDARVIVGYRASEFNEIAGHYTVRQSHAHSWVEVLVAPGLWETFDPSPPDGVDLFAAAPSGLLGRLRQIYGAIDHAWVTWVVGFDESARSRLFGVPQGNQYRMMDHLGRFISMSRGQALARLGRSAAFGVLVFCAVAAAGFLVQAALAWRRGRVRGARAGAGEADAPDPAILAQIGFYRRALVRLKRLGLGKPRWRPPLSHARDIESRSQGAAESVRVLAELYYAARFGRRLLTEEELASAEAALRRLESLDHPGGAPARAGGTLAP